MHYKAYLYTHETRFFKYLLSDFKIMTRERERYSNANILIILNIIIIEKKVY